MKISPLAPKTTVAMPPLDGVRMATCEAGIKYAGRTDLLMMIFDQPVSAAGVFTKSKCSSAPVDWCREALLGDGSRSARGLVVNAGNANAFTGVRGKEATRATAEAAAEVIGCKPDEVFLASTGVIGEPLEAGKFTPLLADLARRAIGDSWQSAAEAIMTTDTYAKCATVSFEVEGQVITVNGIAKGSGMIAPDMATMLSFIVTDMPIDQSLLQEILNDSADRTFNAITVDSDTSTSDTLMVFATGKSGVTRLRTSTDAEFSAFADALHQVLHSLAMQTVRDGEGATKQVEICVKGAESDRSAKKIAMSIANSPLVKTAVAGEDANWGRVVMAVGKAGEPADRDKLAISFGNVRVAVCGERDPDYSEDQASTVMKRDEISILVDVGIGNGVSTVWTCDLTKEYVAINGDYRS